MQSNMEANPSPADLIHSCQGLVRSIAWKIHQRLPPSVDLDDLISYGQVGLAEAARDFDTTRGIQFTTYAYYRIRGGVLDGLSTMSWFSKADYSRGRYEQAANIVLKKASVEPGVTGGMDWFINTTRSLGAAAIVSELTDTYEVASVSLERSPSAAAEADDLKRVVEQAMSSLSDQERSLIRDVYFQGLTIKEAGERIGISKAWASRLHARILQCLGLRLSQSHT